jgi:type IV pilus assembly protein PilN
MDINLLPWREQKRRQRKKNYQWQLLGALILGVMVIGVWQEILCIMIDQVKTQEQKVQAEYVALQPKLSALKQAENDCQALAQLQKFYQEKIKTQAMFIRVLSILSDNESAITLTKLQLQKNIITLQGKSATTALAPLVMKLVPLAQLMPPQIIGDGFTLSMVSRFAAI